MSKKHFSRGHVTHAERDNDLMARLTKDLVKHKHADTPFDCEHCLRIIKNKPYGQVCNNL